MKIKLDLLFEAFNEHLAIDGNHKIFFSGKFGTWKTYFLDSYFKEKEADFDVYHIYPANYQISQNEDVIELIKYDLITLIKEKNKGKSEDIFTENDYKSFVHLPSLVHLWSQGKKKDLTKLAVETGVELSAIAWASITWDIRFFLQILSKIGKPLERTIDLIDDFSKYRDKVISWEEGEIKEFIKAIKGKKYEETDAISQIINQKIKLTKWERESILVIDDLDRIDPEHIFRLLNIFSSQLEANKKSSIKFDFDRIILVGDLHNIKSIYHHKYWPETDFEGYMDKFYDVEAFYLNNEDIIKSIIREIIREFKYSQLHQQTMEEWTTFRILEDILVRSCNLKKNKRISLRELFKCTTYQISSFRRLKNREDTQSFKYNIDLAIFVLITIFWGKSNLIDKLEEMMKNPVENSRTFPGNQTKILWWNIYDFLYRKRYKDKLNLSYNASWIATTNYENYELDLKPERWSYIICGIRNKKEDFEFNQLNDEEKSSFWYLYFLSKYIEKDIYKVSYHDLMDE